MSINHIDKYIDESSYRYSLRLDFISKLDNKIKLEEKIRLSKFWYNIKFNNCKYNKDIYHLITNIDSALKKKY
jgi:hypothetical protein